MALHHRLDDRLPDRFRPWHALMLAVFLLGVALQLARGNSPFTAVLSGLFGLVLFQYVVGSVWSYAVEYHNAGGEWTDLAFVLPVAATAVATVAFFVGVRAAEPTPEALVSSLSFGFWVFVVALGVSVVTYGLFVGYREGLAGVDGSQHAE